jgi:large subunit ribosomal protein L4
MELSLKISGKESSTAEDSVQIAEKIFGCEFKEPLIHQVVTAYLAGGRAGTRAQKSRSEVSGGGKRPWKQKGSGRARAGTIRGPLWRGGGVTFAAKPSNYEQKINKKMYVVALRSIFSELFRQNRLVVVEKIELVAPKTRELLKHLKELQLEKVLIITDDFNENLYLAARNLFQINVYDAKSIDPVSLVKFEKILLTVPALRQIEGMLA